MPEPDSPDNPDVPTRLDRRRYRFVFSRRTPLTDSTIPVAGSQAPVTAPPKDPDASTWRGAPTPTDLPAPVLEKPKTKPVPLLRLRSCQCKWPVSEDPYRFCGLPIAHKAFCEEHAARAYVKPPVKKITAPR
jgi:hypothetical protein